MSLVPINLKPTPLNLFSIRAMFVLAFQLQEVLLQTSKVEIEFSMLFGLAFQNCFYHPKAIFLEATIPSFWLF